MKIKILFFICIAMAGFYAAPVFAAETSESCFSNVPTVDPIRIGLCINATGEVAATPENCAQVSAAGCPTLLLPIPVPCAFQVYWATKCVDAGYEVVRRAVCTEGPRGPGCCISETASPPISFGDKVCTNETEECEDGSKIFYSCCVCEQVVDGNRTQKKLPFPRQTRSTCEALCKALDPPGEIFRQAGAGTLATPTVPGAPTAADLKAKEVMCFTQEECATPEYGGSADAFRPGLGCTKGQGKCVAPEPIINLSMPIGGVSTVQGFREFVAVIFKYIMGIVATAAAVMFVWGGFRYIFGSAAGGIERAKEIMIDATVGLIIALGAVTILQTINPATLKLNALEVFMINRTKFLASEYCADVKSEKPIMFAEAGSRPNYTDVNTAKYEVNQNDARCNQEYYAQGFGEGLCWGRKCDTPGEACVS
ncbi:pilin, partial [Patescibacteria group bacterium]|nr:pilin [Patescibacteria group bacterium]